MASLLDLTQNVSRLTRPTATTRPTRRDPTQYEMEMRYFSQPLKEEEEKKRNRIPLLRKVFEVLQAGNYASANVVDSITDSIKYGTPIGEAAMDAVKVGIMGLISPFARDMDEYKKTFADVITQNAEEHGTFLGRSLEEWTKPIQEEYEGDNKLKTLFNKTIGQSTAAGRVGFLGDVLLDPLTYVSPLKFLKPTGMTTQAARGVATQYAGDVAKLNKALTTLADLKGGARAGVEGTEQFLKKGGQTAARQTDILFRDAYKQALQTPGDVLQKGMQEKVGQLTEQLTDVHLRKTMKELGEEMFEIPEGMVRDIATEKTQKALGGEFENLIQSIERGYQGAGERGMRMFGREVGKGVRPANVAARTIDKFGTILKDKTRKSGIADAWYSWVNGPTLGGVIKKAFGIKNPYQKYLNMITNDAKGVREQAIDQFATASDAALRELGDDLTQKAVNARSIMEQVEFGMTRGVKQAAASQESLRNVLGDRDVAYKIQDLFRGVDDLDTTIKTLKERGLNTKIYEDLKALGITKEEGEKIGKFWDTLDDLFKNMRDEEVELVEDGLFGVDAMGEWVNYIPKLHNMPSIKRRAGKLASPAEPGVMKGTVNTFRQSERQGIELAKEFFGDWINKAAEASGRGVDEVAREFVEKGGLTPISTNLVEMLNARILAHGRIVGRGKLIGGLREFGVPVEALDELGAYSRTAMTRMGDVYNELMPSNDPALKGLLFDKDVKDIVDKTFALTASDDAMNGIKKLFMNYTSWWKGLATATTGFHMRNFFSNNVTGFLRHGTKWFDPRLHARSAAAITYALHPTKYKAILKKNFNLADGEIDTLLGKTIGGKSIKQLAEEARENGIISLKTYMGDVTKEVKPKVDVAKRLNPLSKEFFLPTYSREVGNFIENQARFNSYLITLDDLAKSGVAEETATQFAKLDTKKWFLDYGDLSEFEQKYLKNVIPFYSWLRKNLANQVSGLMLLPDTYRLAAKVEESVTTDDFDYSLVPEYMKQLGYLPVSQGETGPIMWWPNFPYADLNKIPLMFEDGMIPKLDKEGVLEEFGSISHPLIKTVIQALTQKNMFKKRDYLERVEAPELAQLFTKSPMVIAVIDNAMRMIGFDNGAGISERDGKLEMDERLEQLMSNNIPLLRTLGKTLDLGLDLTGFEEAVEEATGRKDPYEGMEDLFQNLTYWAGAKFKEVNEEYEAEQFARQIEREAQSDRSAWKRTLPGYEQRALQYQLQREAQRRRIGL